MELGWYQLQYCRALQYWEGVRDDMDASAEYPSLLGSIMGIAMRICAGFLVLLDCLRYFVLGVMFCVLPPEAPLSLGVMLHFGRAM